MDNNRNLQTNLYKTTHKTDFTEENRMKKNKQTKRNNKKILTGVLLVAFALLMVFGALMISPLKASAATNRAGSSIIRVVNGKCPIRATTLRR